MFSQGSDITKTNLTVYLCSSGPGHLIADWVQVKRIMHPPVNYFYRLCSQYNFAMHCIKSPLLLSMPNLVSKSFDILCMTLPDLGFMLLKYV